MKREMTVCRLGRLASAFEKLKQNRLVNTTGVKSKNCIIPTFFPTPILRRDGDIFHFPFCLMIHRAGCVCILAVFRWRMKGNVH